MSDKTTGNTIGNGSRMHEPSLRELTALLDDLKDLFAAKHDALRAVIDERDKRYSAQFDASTNAVTAALIAADKQTSASFASSEKAIVKAESAQNAYNTSHNDLLRKMDLLIPRFEAAAKWDGHDKELAELRRELTSNREISQKEDATLRAGLMLEIAGVREWKSEQTGKSAGIHAGWVILIGALSLVATLIGIGSFVFADRAQPAPVIYQVPAPVAAPRGSALTPQVP